MGGFRIGEEKKKPLVGLERMEMMTVLATRSLVW